jgi:predicted adenylyl cyclase CyaB
VIPLFRVQAMAIEVEAKMAVPDHEPVRAALRRAGAHGGGLTRETNLFFDTPEQSLLKAGSGLRLRTNRDAKSGAETHVITHKGPLRPGAAKSREETELTVTDAGDATRLLEQLGYRKTLSFQKRRETWKLRDCKVELDEVPHLGRFVEVEGPDEATVLKVREELGLADLPMIKAGYISLLTDYLKSRGDARAEVNFPAG